MDESEFRGLQKDYDDFITKTAKEVGTNVNATYGLKGKAAAWDYLKGGAGQIVTPFSGVDLQELGIII